MALRTVEEMIAAIARRTGGRVPRMEIFDALQNSNNEVHNKHPWPWTKADFIIRVQGTYTTGTVSIVNGTTAVTGTGTNWDPTWLYKRIYFGTNNVDYIVASVNSPTSLTLAQPINLKSDQTDVGYTIFQDTYALPADCDFGSILLVVNPIFRYKMKYIPTYTFEWQSVYSRVFFNQFQSCFSDAGFDQTNNVGLIRLGPAPGSVAEYRMIYRLRPPDLTTLAQNTMLPPAYDRLLESLAEYKVRFHQPTPMPGWMECRATANEIMKDMRRNITSTMYDTFANFAMFDTRVKSSAYDAGAGVFIGVTTGSL